MSLESVLVKEEPGCAVTDHEQTCGSSYHPGGAPCDHNHVKTEYPPAAECVKLEPFYADSEGSCSVSEAAMPAGLYTDHVIKEELVLGPECVQHPPACGDSEAAMLAELYTDHVVKEELVLGPECVQHPPAGGDSEAAMLAELYTDHVVKEELVLGPECVQHPPACGDSEAAMLAELYTDHVVKEELVLGPECVQRRVPAVSREEPNIFIESATTSQVPSEHNTAPRQTRAGTDTTAYVAPHANDDAGTSQPRPCEFSGSHVYTQSNMSENISTLTEELSFLTEEGDGEIDELSKKRKPSVLKQLKGSDQKFIEYFRLSQEEFVKVLHLIESDIADPKPVSPVQKLAVTIRFLATGENLRLLSLQHRIPHTNLPEILKTTFQVICKHLKPIYLPEVTEERLANVAKQFVSKYNFPNCCGALEGKHCRVLCRRDNGSLFHNHEQCPSVVIIALIDADSKFICVDIESGKQEVTGTFLTSALGKRIIHGRFPFPANAKLPGSDIDFPHFLIGGSGFKLLPQIMTPFYGVRVTDVLRSQYNKRIGHPLSTVKIAFGLLANTFQVFHNVTELDTETVESLMLASCCLHNMLLENGPSVHSYSYNANQNNLMPLRNTGSPSNCTARDLRNQLKDYLGDTTSSWGQLPSASLSYSSRLTNLRKRPLWPKTYGNKKQANLPQCLAKP